MERKSPRVIEISSYGKKAMDVVVESYKLAKILPREKLFGLRAQIQRAAVSVPANIAQGFGRWNRKEYVHHLRIAAGSVSELETHILITSRLGYFQEVDTKHLLTQTDEIGVCSRRWFGEFPLSPPEALGWTFPNL